MAPHSSTRAWKIPWTRVGESRTREEPRRLQSTGSLGVRHYWATSLSLACIGEGNSNPLQCSCLENPRDGGAWWAAIYGVAQSRTRLKWLSSSPTSLFCRTFGSPSIRCYDHCFIHQCLYRFGHVLTTFLAFLISSFIADIKVFLLRVYW